MKLQPLYDQVLIRRKDSENRSSGGIVIPDNAKEAPTEGEVMAVGRGRALEIGSLAPMYVKAGDRVLFGKYAGVETTLDGEKYVLVRESEILGIFKT